MHRRELVHFSEKLRHLRPIRRCAGYLAAVILGTAAAAAAPAASEGPSVTALLDAAEAAERANHLIYPARGSAMSLYHEVLFTAPGNEHAMAGLTRLAEHHLELAQIALDQGQLLKADAMVSKARMIYPQYPAIDAMSHQIELLENASRTRETLDWRLVASRSGDLKPQLYRLGGIAKTGDCRVTINVSNDAEGRWVFQQMNAADGEHRVRARVKIASPAAVDILCFEPGENTG